MAPHPTLDKALCTICNEAIRCCKSNLIEHSQSVQHLEEINSKNLNFDYLDTANSRVTLSHKDKVKRAEIKLAAFFSRIQHFFLFRGSFNSTIERYLHSP